MGPRCELCDGFISFEGYVYLSDNPRYEVDSNVYVAHTKCVEQCNNVEVIDTYGDLSLVKVNEE